MNLFIQLINKSIDRKIGRDEVKHVVVDMVAETKQSNYANPSGEKEAKGIGGSWLLESL